MTPLQSRIVSVAKSEASYQTMPRNSYCNRFSAYWHSGSTACPAGERGEEWCADFAAWVWRRAGVRFTYGYGPTDINASAISIYKWGLAQHTWHPAKGYSAAPGDIAVYGLVLGANPSAAHVAIVTDDTAGSAGPDVVDGDGDRTGFSEVDVVADQLRAVANEEATTISGYVAPPARAALHK